jgi:hypothetical protein
MQTSIKVIPNRGSIKKLKKNKSKQNPNKKSQQGCKE